jgi:phosphatidylglycerol:prolipoprotein diacylglycerol transferase
MTDTAWVHNISPFLIEFTEGFGIRYYGLAYLAGFFLAFYFVDMMARRGLVPMTREQAADLITYAAIGTMVGGRIGYVFFYSPELLTTFHSQFPYWGLLEVHKGGMASHGGIIGIATGCMLFARKHKLDKFLMIDVTCMGGTLGVFFGRIANFINGELYGRECPPNHWMAVKFPSEIYAWSVQDPKIAQLGPAAQALGEVTTRQGQKISVTSDLWASWAQNLNFESERYIDLFREALVKATEKHNAAVIDALAPVLTPRYPSQLIQAFLEGFLIFVVIMIVWWKPRKAGVISCLFGLSYAVMRIIGEQFRMPDRDIGFQALGLTRGQWLSIAMFIAISIMLYFVQRRQTPLYGGWQKLFHKEK